MAAGNSKKHGRDAKKCQRYKSEGRKEKNKARRKDKEEKRQAKFSARKEARMAAAEERRQNKEVPLAIGPDNI